MKLEIQDFVKVTKVGVTLDAVFRSATMEEWVPGGVNDELGLPQEYSIEGAVTALPVVGKRFEVFRSKRMGVQALGLFITSVVKRVEDSEDHMLVHTENSVYKVERIYEELKKE